MPELRFVIEALIESLKKSIYVLILIFILLYIYAVGGVILFEDVVGGRFEDLGGGLHCINTNYDFVIMGKFNDADC